MIKLKSKSLLFESIIDETDKQLAAIPTNEPDGSPTAQSLNLDMYIDSIANISFTDGINRKHYPFEKTIATILVEDELESRNLEPTMEDIYGNNARTKE